MKSCGQQATKPFVSELPQYLASSEIQSLLVHPHLVLHPEVLLRPEPHYGKHYTEIY